MGMVQVKVRGEWSGGKGGVREVGGRGKGEVSDR